MSLSDKIIVMQGNKEAYHNYIHKGDVKGFIQAIRKRFCLSEEEDCNCTRCQAINEEAGDKLI